MKKLLLIAALIAANTVASYSQGLVSISLSAGSLISTNGPTATGRITGLGAFYFELLISSNLGLVGSTANNILSSPTLLSLWSDSGVSGTNGTSILSGKILSRSSVMANGWALPGAPLYDNPMAYMIVGWSANCGTTWSDVASGISSGDLWNAPGYFGTTVIAQNYAGGGPYALPAVNLWGNQTGTPGFGITTAPYLTLDYIPEPSTLALAGLGGLSLWLLRRRR
jgi:hypothetical protein